MPELPEVQTIVDELNQKIVGKTIGEIKILSPKSFVGDKNVLIGKTIKRIRRRAKILVFELDGGFFAVHLKMTGQLIYQKSKIKNQNDKSKFKNELKHKRVIIHFTDKSQLVFNDLRKFGWIKVLDKNGLDKIETDHGIEPFSKDFSKEKFYQIISTRRIPIKIAIMDQSKLVGVGNIYSNEALFCAGIMPNRPANKVTKIESNRLHECILSVLKQAIKDKGTSSENYVRTDGSLGGHDKNLMIYGKKGQKCPKCSGKVEWMKIGGRGSFYCSKCQK